MDMTDRNPSTQPSRLSGEDMTFWAVDSPLQPTTMAMLMLLDAPMDEKRLRQAFERAVHAVPRLASASSTRRSG